MIDACRMWTTNANGSGSTSLAQFRLSTRVKTLDQPDGQPSGWTRGGLGHNIARVLTLPDSAAGPRAGVGGRQSTQRRGMAMRFVAGRANEQTQARRRWNGRNCLPSAPPAATRSDYHLCAAGGLRVSASRHLLPPANPRARSRAGVLHPASVLEDDSVSHAERRRLCRRCGWLPRGPSPGGACSGNSSGSNSSGRSSANAHVSRGTFTMISAPASPGWLCSASPCAARSRRAHRRRGPGADQSHLAGNDPLAGGDRLGG